MVDPVKVETSLGTFEVKKPKAGTRNKALIKAEINTGKISNTVLMVTLLPKCIHKRPEGADKDVPIDQLLDSLELEDYDALVTVLGDLMEPPKISEVVKNQ